MSEICHAQERAESLQYRHLRVNILEWMQQRLVDLTCVTSILQNSILFLGSCQEEEICAKYLLILFRQNFLLFQRKFLFFQALLSNDILLEALTFFILFL